MFRLLSYTLRGVLAWNEDAPEPELASVVSEDTFYSESSQTEVSWTVSILDLDPEILRSVTRHLARKELSRLSQTCQALHRVLTLHLLTYGPITLNADTMDSFSHFMNRDSPDDERHSLLRSLTVHPLRGESKHGLTPLLLSFACEGILARASGLTSLTITDVARAFSPLQLHMIFDELPALQHLTLEGLPTGSEYKSILYESTAPLRTVTLAQGAWVPKDAATDAFELLRKHGATLTRITLRFLLPLPKWTLYHFPKPRVEEVRLSALQCSFADGVGWGYALASLFPNVRRVHVGRLCYNGLVLAARDTLGDPSKVSLARLVDDQRQHNHRMAEEHGECWRRLDVLAVGSVLELYHLGLSCTVHHLEFGALGGPLELGYACAALADVRPEKVGCTVRTRDLDGNLASFFEVVIAVDSMRRLILDLTDVAVSPFILGPQGRLETFKILADAPSLTHLFLSITSEALCLRHADDDDPDKMDGVEEHVVDPTVLSRALAATIPTLQWTFLEIFYYPSKRPQLRTWKMANTRDKTWVELSSDKVREALAAQDMMPYEGGFEWVNNAGGGVVLAS